jgi:hypothetical protein
LAYGNDAHRHLKTDLSESSIAALEDFSGFLFERGFLPAAVDVRRWIDPQPLAVALRSLSSSARTERDGALGASVYRA